MYINVSDVKVVYVYRYPYTHRSTYTKPKDLETRKKYNRRRGTLSSGAIAEWSDIAELETQRVEVDHKETELFRSSVVMKILQTKSSLWSF